ncbi:YfhO family protein [Acidiphilium sp. AL]|uniref:YfhO family protein n=1 Tax=Acidiphilium iwatense TaxID=768198 RepID=A0ABS9E0D2_9PROT|nr:MULTISPECIES: YfhO family protein [Acidiphilium]MCF3947855.1 YfhO family protein [Acidiphilium iwatense]MCU4160050.1 YfhO family protein [Acidiphilium sp. AL]
MVAALRRHFWPLLGFAALPCLANLLLIAGVMHADPALFFSSLATHLRLGPWPGSPTWFDPTIGLITEAQGMLSAKDWLAGIIPWWNPYTGIGMPLAAEMQTLSFFLPFVLLLRLAHGWLILRLVLQGLSGVALYALLLELGATRFAAFAAGALYALSGTFFMVPHAAGPLPFMPLLLLGIERAARAAEARTPLGWGGIAASLAAMLYAGYPEIAYFGGLLAAVWTLRHAVLLGADRWRFAGKIALGAGLGLAFAAPLLIPFLHYVAVSFLGPHGGFFARIAVPYSGLPLPVLPFIYGPIAAPAPASLVPPYGETLGIAWSQLGTWFGVVALGLASAALTCRTRHRGLVLVLAGYVLVWALRLRGVAPVRFLVNLIPFVGASDAIRFASPAMDLALLVMAGLALDRWQRDGALPRRAVLGAGALLGLIVAVSVWPALPALRAWYRASPDLLNFGMIACFAELACAASVLLLLAARPARAARLILAVLALGDATAALASGQFSAAWSGRLERGGVTFLAQHQGLARFFTLLPFGPNYPASSRIASINSNQLPVAANWIAYGQSHLGWKLFSTIADQTAALRRHIPAYQALGVKYVLAPPGDNPFRDTEHLRLDPATIRAINVQGATEIHGGLPAGLVRLRRIAVVSVLIGTYDGAARGPLLATLCAGTDCAHGAASLDRASDDAYLPIHLDHVLDIPPGTALRYRFRHPSGSGVAFWTGRIAADGKSPPITAPRLGFSTPLPQPAPRLVYRDQVMRIYSLAGVSPFYTAQGCTLAGAGWNRVTADCPAPTRLIRREAWFGGWHARIGGKPVPIAHAGPLFQSVMLPAGRSRVVFFYRPRLTRLACALALAALVLAAGLMIRDRRMLGGMPVPRL